MYMVDFGSVVQAVAYRLLDPEVALSYARPCAAAHDAPPFLTSSFPVFLDPRFVEQERRTQMEERMESFIALERITGLIYNWSLRRKIARTLAAERACRRTKHTTLVNWPN